MHEPEVKLSGFLLPVYDLVIIISVSHLLHLDRFILKTNRSQGKDRTTCCEELSEVSPKLKLYIDRIPIELFGISLNFGNPHLDSSFYMKPKPIPILLLTYFSFKINYKDNV